MTEQTVEAIKNDPVSVTLTNARLLERFLQTVLESGANVRITRKGKTIPDLIEYGLERCCSGSAGEVDPVFALKLVQISREPLSPHTKSGDLSTTLEKLERQLRAIREGDTTTPLAVYDNAEIYWPRSHCWMLGEYLVERGLPLWVDVTRLHPARAVDWLNMLCGCGLLGPSSVIEMGPLMTGQALPSLEGSGTWLLKSYQPGQFEIVQV